VYKHILAYIFGIFAAVGFRKAQIAEVILKVTQGHCLYYAYRAILAERHIVAIVFILLGV